MSALPFFPQGKCFLHGILFRVQPPALDGLTNKRFLVGGELYFHDLQGSGKPSAGQRRKLTPKTLERQRRRKQGRATLPTSCVNVGELAKPPDMNSFLVLAGLGEVV